MTGKIKSFNAEKGYGFITGNDGNEYYIHAKHLTQGIYNDGDVVIFEIVESRNGIEAVNVKGGK